MPDKIIRMNRSQAEPGSRPVMLAVAGDSASGKTTFTTGLVEALGPDRCLAICVDDYHRFDRTERAKLPITPLHPACNYIDIVEQHLQLLALGRPVLKPVYDHATGTFARPNYVEPREFVIVEGLHPLRTRLTRACFDVMVFLDPPEDIRREWKVRRDHLERGYTTAEVVADLERREPESEEFIRPQRRFADIVVRFAKDEGRDDPQDTPLSAELMLRPTIRHPALGSVLTDDTRTAMHLKIIRDRDGTPTDCLHIHGHASAEEARMLAKAIWTQVGASGPPPTNIGDTGDGRRSDPLALSQLIVLYHLLFQTDEGDGHENAAETARR